MGEVKANCYLGRVTAASVSEPKVRVWWRGRVAEEGPTSMRKVPEGRDQASSVGE